MKYYSIDQNKNAYLQLVNEEVVMKEQPRT